MSCFERDDFDAILAVNPEIGFETEEADDRFSKFSDLGRQDVSRLLTPDSSPERLPSMQLSASAAKSSVDRLDRLLNLERAYTVDRPVYDLSAIYLSNSDRYIRPRANAA